MKSSYPFGSCPNLELWHHHRILKTNIRHYDVISSYIENTYTTLWRHNNLCCLCQMRENTNGRLLQGKGLKIQINNKTIIEFGSRRIWGIIKASVCVICLSLRLRQITQTSALIIPHIPRRPYCLTIDILGPRLPTHTWRGRHMYEESKMASSTGQKTRELYYEKKVFGLFWLFNCFESRSSGLFWK